MNHVHFIYLGGDFLWGHRRAIETARVHESPITVWCAEEPTGDEWDAVGDITVRELGDDGSHKAGPYLKHPMGLANVKDLFAWSILWEHGGLYLDLDTISLRPCWDILTRDVCVSLEHEPDFTEGHPYNSAVVIGKQDADVLAGRLAERADDILARGETRWGSCGPHLLTDVVAEHPDAFDIAPFGVLNGYRDGTAIRYYNGERPGPETRVAHLFSSSRFHLFEDDRWMPEMVPMLTKLMIVPWVGPLPNWVNLWAHNVESIYAAGHGWQFLLDTDEERIRQRIESLGVTCPPLEGRKLCDYRPAFGEMYADEIEGFDFWGHTDLDCVYFDLWNYVTDELLAECDVFSNDPYPDMCGPFSLYRTATASHVFRDSPNWQAIFEDHAHHAFDETGIAPTIASSNLRVTHEHFEGPDSMYEHFCSTKEYPDTLVRT